MGFASRARTPAWFCSPPQGVCVPRAFRRKEAWPGLRANHTGRREGGPAGRALPSPALGEMDANSRIRVIQLHLYEKQSLGDTVFPKLDSMIAWCTDATRITEASSNPGCGLHLIDHSGRRRHRSHCQCCTLRNRVLVEVDALLLQMSG